VKRIAVIHLNQNESSERAILSRVTFLGRELEIQRIGCGGDPAEARRLIAELDGQVDAIGLEGLPAQLELGPAVLAHKAGQELPGVAQQTPVVDGRGVRAGLERWGVILADRAEPGIFSRKRVAMVPGLNHGGLAQALGRRSPDLRYADPIVYFGIPDVPGVGRRVTLAQAGPRTLAALQDAPFRRILPQAGMPGTPRWTGIFEWADILAGDMGAIRRYAPPELKRKTVVVEWATDDDLADLRQRRVNIVVTMMPPLDDGAPLGRWSAAAVEAALVAMRANPGVPLSEDTYLDLMADLSWQPAVCYLQPEQAGINRFAFVMHPLSLRFVHSDRRFRWTRYLPGRLVEFCVAYLPPLYISRITGGQSPATGQRIEGYLLSLGTTPREMMRRDPNFTYQKLVQSARKAERLGARIMGLGAFTSVVGDAGVTVAHNSDIAITSGNSLTVAATLEAAKQAMIRLGIQDLTRGKVMIIGATGSIGSVCSRLLAQAIYDVVLVSIEPERLLELKRTILAETPGARVAIATRPDEHLASCDLIVTATSAFGQRIVDISKCKPGAVICDVARPPDISEAEASLRPDVLVIESGEVLIPGDIDFGYDIGLPPKTAYACLAETALLAMEGRFEDYTLGREITMERVKEIYRLFKKHEFQLAGLRTFGEYITEEDLQQKVSLAEQYRSDPALFARVQQEAGTKIAAMPVMAKGVSASNGPNWPKYAAGVAAGAGLLWLLFGRKRD
jgi:predicted amino acid dehydrogenase